MLRVNQLIGFGAGVSVLKDVEIMQSDTVNDRSNLSTYNFTCDIGNAEQGRVVFAMIGARDNAFFTLDSVTINGVSATRLGGGSQSFGGQFGRAEIWAAQVNNGTGDQTVSAVFSDTLFEAEVTTLAARNVSNHTTLVDSLDDSGDSNSVLNGSITIPAGGIIVACMACDDIQGSPVTTWASLTEISDFDAGGHEFSAAQTISATETSVDVSASLEATREFVAFACSLR